MVNPVLPTIEAALGTDQATVSWVLTAYLLSASVFTPIIGRVGDKVGKERMLVVALIALAAGSLMAAVATSIGVLIAARVVQGVGGGVLPLTFGIIRDEFPRDRVAGAIGTAAALLAVGGGVGLV
ncbi:MAG: MFS transporter, partial [Nocardioidaceae bacterium]|nr:MFS transporter [Nocardioidaceae bacterium]